MENKAKVVIIGGGVVGCSILYHLSKFGLKNCENSEFIFSEFVVESGEKA